MPRPRTQPQANRPSSGSTRDLAWSRLLDIWLELRTSDQLDDATREAAAKTVHLAMLALAGASAADDELTALGAISEAARMLAAMPDTRAYVATREARDALRATIRARNPLVPA